MLKTTICKNFHQPPLNEFGKYLTIPPLLGLFTRVRRLLVFLIRIVFHSGSAGITQIWLYLINDCFSSRCVWFHKQETGQESCSSQRCKILLPLHSYWNHWTMECTILKQQVLFGKTWRSNSSSRLEFLQVDFVFFIWTFYSITLFRQSSSCGDVQSKDKEFQQVSLFVSNYW